MKKLQCEMCSGTDFVKEDGIFVCQGCGLKYTLDEAKKLMADGTDDASGASPEADAPSKPAMSEEAANLLMLARRSKDAENEEDAQKYYEMLLIKVPNNWEAYFFSVYYKSWNCKVGQIGNAAANVKNCINETFVLIRDYVTDLDERVAAVREVSTYAKRISTMLFEAALKHADTLGDDYMISGIVAATIAAQVCDSIYELFADDENIMRGCGCEILKARIAEGISEDHTARFSTLIQKYEPDYTPPVKEEKPAPAPSPVRSSTGTSTSTGTGTTNTSGGCYVATAVYGSYDCPEVWTLRRFRDYSLAETWYGRAFVKTYYAISPTLVKWFGETKWFKAMWRKVLDKMVSNLQEEGFEATPYDDKQW